MHAHDGRDRAVAGGDLLDGEGVGQVAGAAAAPFIGYQHAHKAQFAQAGDGFGREGVVAVPLGGEGGQPLGGEAPG